MPSAPHGPSFPQNEPAQARLDSWKEIAKYLGKGERTVKRWEARRSLPVHRVPGGGHGSVYAYTTELDEWLRSERPKANVPEDVCGQTEPHRDIVDGAEAMPEPGRLPSGSPVAASRSWPRVVPYAVVFAGVAVVLAYFVNLPTTKAYTSSLLHSLLSRVSSSPSNPEKRLAHELYLRGRFEWNRRTPDSLNRALDYFTQSIVHDPANAQAYVGLADSYNLLREYTLMPENEAYARAIAASKKAIELDDSLAEAHRSLAFDEIWGNWDFQAGEKEFQRAMELNPRDPLAHLWFANAFAAPGWFPICLREVERAQELDPSSHAILADKGLMLFHSGKVQEGLELVKQVEQADPEFLSPHRYLAEIYLTLREYPDFLGENEKMAEISHDQVLKDTTAAARSGFQSDGERGLFRKLYAKQNEFHTEGKLNATALAITCARMGKRKEAIQLLAEDYDKHNPQFLALRQNLELLSLKDEPGYQELLSRLHLPAPPAGADTRSTTSRIATH